MFGHSLISSHTPVHPEPGVDLKPLLIKPGIDQFNRDRGRLPGQLRLRVRFRHHISPWFDYLMVSQEEMKQIIYGTGWKVTRFFQDNDSRYVAIIDKTSRN